ncbi:hypothetical protein ATE68_02410 [Sphingopyxis sp. H038]|uniref:hypothetical protein n=1 Tax=unclassified Sphingopyxis TaxID=2614943 RepID=UPI0007309656|nr:MULTISPECIES: hypothetical protein [unclassified Sphingopyxis]KTE13285.1 hypothetical protein ATE70_01005 [Sphingopyxis sp. H053]KTE14474.1 hypothetical protein ATE76_08570 [Sphingopyxis sp. H093]KTE04503.1 hypothetical protein ATE78_02365 [Sphingopyxis sp. H012]KTE31125.1 hypothetical protein ATE75_00980 [Sphingopyxis sp. H080]KTE37002.1 hypothetical protein ATE68_02410 [Sphingopyxis sp. H038]
MVIDCRPLLAAVALLTSASAAFAAPPVVAPEVEREVTAPEGVTFAPTPADEEGAIDRLAAYTMALAKRDYASAYAMLRLSFQASNPRLEWEMNQRKRAGLWADGTIRILRLSWYLDPAGQPAGLYAAFDFRGDRPDKTMDCGYVVVHRATPVAGWTVVRTDTSEVPANLIEDGVPKADVLRELPCYLGKGIATNF